jgi:16S rRNA processing protein RimM
MAVTLPLPTRIGAISSAHGVQGEVLVSHFLKKPKEVLKWQVLMIELNKGSIIPFFITQVRALQDESFIVKLEGINSPEEAKALRHSKVYASPFIKEVLLQTDDWEGLIGFSITDPLQNLNGRVARIDKIASSDYFVVDHQGQEVLIPILDEFIKTIHAEQQQIILQLPEGYMEAFAG